MKLNEIFYFIFIYYLDDFIELRFMLLSELDTQSRYIRITNEDGLVSLIGT